MLGELEDEKVMLMAGDSDVVGWMRRGADVSGR